MARPFRFAVQNGPPTWVVRDPQVFAPVVGSLNGGGG